MSTHARVLMKPDRRAPAVIAAAVLALFCWCASAPLRGADATAEPAVANVQSITSAAELKTLLAGSQVPVIIDFSAVWCGPCKLLHPELVNLAKAHPTQVTVALVDVDQLPEVAQAYQVSAMPTLIMIAGGKTTATHLGFMTAADLTTWAGLDGGAAPAASAPAAAPAVKPASAPPTSSNEVPPGTGPAPFTSDTTRLRLTDEQWKARLAPDLYDVSRRKSTEPPFCGGYTAIEHNGPGIYHCAACGAPLFISDTKFDSGSGWPSFFRAIPGRVDEQPDTSYGMDRTEVHCARCGGHLGHLFSDGPAPTGMRYCINAITLSFEPKAAAPAAKP